MEIIHAFIEKYKIIIGIALLAGATAGGVYYTATARSTNGYGLY